jgi:hypothetical protein
VARNSFNSENFLNIARGKIPNASHINKFGYNESVGTSFELITDLGTNVLPSSAGVVTLVSADTNDTSAGTGARTVEVQGLDENYLPLTETFTMNGTTNVIGSESFLRVFRMRVLSAGTGEINAGNITASIGGSDVARILADKGQTLMAVYTIPAGKTGYLTKFQGSLSKNQEAVFKIRVKQFNNGFNVKGQFGTFSNSITYDYPIPLQFKEKTDIQIMGKAGATSEMGAVFDILLIDGA